jgi:hypothetical protein
MISPRIKHSLLAMVANFALWNLVLVAAPRTGELTNPTRTEGRDRVTEVLEERRM